MSTVGHKMRLNSIRRKNMCPGLGGGGLQRMRPVILRYFLLLFTFGRVGSICFSC